jgi:hypothetical protein
MPRHGHWVIFAANAPTAFRAKHRETLLPTLKQLQRTQPDAVMRWFDGGRLWASPEEADEARRLRRLAPKRPVGWRPGGEHRDPRARFEISRDEKRARFKRRLQSRFAGGDRKSGPGGGPPAPDGKRGRGWTQRPAGAGPRSRRPRPAAKPKRGPK